MEETKVEEKNNEPKPQWKGCIIFGLINIGLVLLCTKLNFIMLSVGVIIIIIVGACVSFQAIKEDWKEGFKLSVFGCVVGLLLNIFSGVLYVINVLAGLVGLFGAFFSLFSK